MKNQAMKKSKLIEMNNVGIVVETLDHAISFFTEIGLELEGRDIIEGEWTVRITGLGNQHVEVTMMVTPIGHTRLAISKFTNPQLVSDHVTAHVNALGYLTDRFKVDNLDELI